MGFNLYEINCNIQCPKGEEMDFGIHSLSHSTSDADSFIIISPCSQNLHILHWLIVRRDYPIYVLYIFICNVLLGRKLKWANVVKHTHYRQIDQELDMFKSSSDCLWKCSIQFVCTSISTELNPKCPCLCFNLWQGRQPFEKANCNFDHVQDTLSV